MLLDVNEALMAVLNLWFICGLSPLEEVMVKQLTPVYAFELIFLECPLQEIFGLF
jgi:hypothetical protein